MFRINVNLNRRDFIRGSSAAVAGAAATSAFGTAAIARPVQDKAATPKVGLVTLGRTSEKVSRLGIGCAPFQREQITPDDIHDTLTRALELGVNYLDVAPNYGNAPGSYSEEKMGPSLKDKALRKQFFLVTKTEEETRDGTWRLLEQSLKRLQTDHVDMVHLHNIGEEDRWVDFDKVFGDNGAVAALREAREQGLVRFIGSSGHLYPSRFHRIIDSGEVDVLMNAVNFVVQHTYDFEHKVWARARQENMGLVAMKVLGGQGDQPGGFRLPEDQYENAIRYALSIPGLCVAVIGMEGVSELEKAAGTVASVQPLSEEESIALARRGLELIAETDRWRTAYGTPLT